VTFSSVPITRKVVAASWKGRIAKTVMLSSASMADRVVTRCLSSQIAKSALLWQSSHDLQPDSLVVSDLPVGTGTPPKAI
jgi:hypothetical protein